MFFLRSFAYLFLVIGVAQLISIEGYQQVPVASYGEHSFTEHMQDMMSFLSCLLFLYAAFLGGRLKIASMLLAALLAIMFVRESDSLLDHYVFDGAWQSIASLIVVCLLLFLRKEFSSIYISLKEYSKEPSFGIFLAGFVTIFGFSRLMGRGSFWQSVMGDAYLRIVKNIVEEGIETLGYTLILISAIELVAALRKKNRGNTLLVARGV